MGDDPSSLRCFVALLLDTAVLDELQAFQKLLRKQIPTDALRWTRVDQMHLTLRFLGEVSAAACPSIEEGIRKAASVQRPLRLQLGKAGVFPDAVRPRVLWAGVVGDLDPLAAMQADLERGLVDKAAGEEDRPFQPHLTLARLRRGMRPDPACARAAAETRGPQPVAWTVRELHFMRSELEPRGARYTVLRSFPLGALGGTFDTPSCGLDRRWDGQ